MIWQKNHSTTNYFVLNTGVNLETISQLPTKKNDSGAELSRIEFFLCRVRTQCHSSYQAKCLRNLKNQPFVIECGVTEICRYTVCLMEHSTFCCTFRRIPMFRKILASKLKGRMKIVVNQNLLSDRKMDTFKASEKCDHIASEAERAYSRELLSKITKGISKHTKPQ